MKNSPLYYHMCAATTFLLLGTCSHMCMLYSQTHAFTQTLLFFFVCFFHRVEFDGPHTAAAGEIQHPHHRRSTGGCLRRAGILCLVLARKPASVLGACIMLISRLCVQQIHISSVTSTQTSKIQKNINFHDSNNIWLIVFLPPPPYNK